jgi:hypothetical protein
MIHLFFYKRNHTMHEKTIGSFPLKDQNTSQPIENEVKQENFSALPLIDCSPIRIFHLDAKLHVIVLEIGPEYPLYPILKIFNSCFLKTEYIYSLTPDLIQKAYLDTVNAMTNSEKKFLIQNAHQFELVNASLFFISFTLQHLNSSKTPNLIHLAEINLKLVKFCKKHTFVKKFKADMNVSFEDFLSGALEALAYIHHLLENYELTETYCYQLLDLYPSFKLRDQGNMARRYCEVYGTLAEISFEFGHTENAIKFLIKCFYYIKKTQIDNFDRQLDNLGKTTEKIINHCKERADYLSAIKVISLTKTTITALNEKIIQLSLDDKKLFISWQKKFNQSSAQGKLNLLGQGPTY